MTRAAVMERRAEVDVEAIRSCVVIRDAVRQRTTRACVNGAGYNVRTRGAVRQAVFVSQFFSSYCFRSRWVVLRPLMI